MWPINWWHWFLNYRQARAPNILYPIAFLMKPFLSHLSRNKNYTCSCVPWSIHSATKYPIWKPSESKTWSDPPVCQTPVVERACTRHESWPPADAEGSMVAELRSMSFMTACLGSVSRDGHCRPMPCRLPNCIVVRRVTSSNVPPSKIATLHFSGRPVWVSSYFGSMLCTVVAKESVEQVKRRDLGVLLILNKECLVSLSCLVLCSFWHHGKRKSGQNSDWFHKPLYISWRRRRTSAPTAWN